MSGWIKIHRSFNEWRWKKDPYAVAVFIHLLLRAEWENRFYKKILIPRGSLCTSINALSESCGVARGTVRRVLQDFLYSAEVTIKTTNKYTMISIVNYDKYQQLDTAATNNLVSTVTSNLTRNLDTSKKLRTQEERILCPPDDALKILAMMNEACGTGFKNSKTSIAPIQARLKEKYTIEDFEKVIQFKSNSWRSDPKMSEYLRPKTLFGPNFDSYLQAASKNVTMSEARALEIIRQAGLG